MNQTNAVINYVDQGLSILNQIQGLSAVGLVALLCLATGYAWRFLRFKWFPNDAIPLVVMFTGSIFMMLLSDARPTNMPIRIWTVRNFVVGFIIGAGMWALHNYVLWRLECWLRDKVPALNDTTFFSKDNTQQQQKQNDETKNKSDS